MIFTEHAHASAEPGLLFWDTMTKYHNAEYCSPLVSTNPCAEQPLPDGGCCNLGALNLERFVDKNGNYCPLADNLINFEISGPATIAAVGNGNAATTEPFQANYRKAFMKGGVISFKCKSFKEVRVLIVNPDEGSL